MKNRTKKAFLLLSLTAMMLVLFIGALFEMNFASLVAVIFIVAIVVAVVMVTRLLLSFRSTRDVLSAVDQVFLDAANARGLTPDGGDIVHASNRGREPGDFVHIRFLPKLYSVLPFR